MPGLKRVDSTAVRLVGYNKRKRTLRVRFTSGQTYVYKDVPQEIYGAVINADAAGESVGKTLHAHNVLGKGAQFTAERARSKT